jgi:ABC-type glycerol-3-phosphate transport system substrate-binding protein
VLPGLRASTAWNGVPGGELGSSDAKQWCIPWGYELNNISYNQEMFEKAGVKPPKNLPEMAETSAKPRTRRGLRRDRTTAPSDHPPCQRAGLPR